MNGATKQYLQTQKNKVKKEKKLNSKFFLYNIYYIYIYIQKLTTNQYYPVSGEGCPI